MAAKKGGAGNVGGGLALSSLSPDSDLLLLRDPNSSPGETAATAPGLASPQSEGVAPGQEQEQQGAVIHGGIPLIRYSRYRSEFQELQALGKGGFGTVFRCKNNLDGREYAMKKVTIRGVTTDPSFQQRLQRVLREVKVLAVLDHPSIVRYYTAWLELEEENGDESTSHNQMRTADEGTSRCYSSSFLTETESQWRSPPKKSKTTFASSRNPLGWQDFSEVEEEDDEESSSMFLPHHVIAPSPSEDIGFIFDRSSEGAEQATSTKGDASSGPSADKGKAVSRAESRQQRSLTKEESSRPTKSSPESSKPVVKHTLYIQMQLCSSHTVSDFLSDAEARSGSSRGTGVDIPWALRLFLQITQAVSHVHEQDLIHRDLKPSNVFMDKAGDIKVGDFGLSRGSADKDVSSGSAADLGVDFDFEENDDQTAGVGTRLYASPEQTNGSDYDSSTDVFSLGIMLFELCYPMYTGMERNICLSKLRQNDEFPKDWRDVVGNAFPTLKSLIQSMVSPTPSERPTAAAVGQHIQDVLGELTILSLDQLDTSTAAGDLIFLRVEADHSQDALPYTISQIHEAAQPGEVDIVEYGLSHAKHSRHAIMEFALRSTTTEGSGLVSNLQKRPKIHVARQVSTSTSGSSRS